MAPLVTASAGSIIAPDYPETTVGDA